jgi:hypothetical protein
MIKKHCRTIFDQNVGIIEAQTFKNIWLFFYSENIRQRLRMQANCISKSFVSLPVQDLFRMGPPLAGSWGVSLLADLTITDVRVQIL